MLSDEVAYYHFLLMNQVELTVKGIWRIHDTIRNVVWALSRQWKRIVNSWWLQSNWTITYMLGGYIDKKPIIDHFKYSNRSAVD